MFFCPAQKEPKSSSAVLVAILKMTRLLSRPAIRRLSITKSSSIETFASHKRTVVCGWYIEINAGFLLRGRLEFG